MGKTPASTDRVDNYELVTNKIIAALEAGTVPWRKPWGVGGALSRNMGNGALYRGVNRLLLSLTPYDSPWWGTARLIAKKGGAIRDGEQPTTVIWWKILEKEDEETGKRRRVPVLKVYGVYNEVQCTGLELPRLESSRTGFEPEVEAEAVLERMSDRPTVAYGYEHARYLPLFDRIELPSRDRFDNAGAFCRTAFHELGHATGHPNRLNRKEIAKEKIVFGDKDYATEELVADLTAAMVCATVGIHTTVPCHANYIAGWLKALRGDKKMVVNAASRAQKAADCILGNTKEGKDA